MEWVETTGKSVDEATEVALKQLGVLASEAEIEVLEEPRQGMFGRSRGSARVRARIQPTAPAPKQEKRRRAKKPTAARSNGDSRSEGSSGGRGPSDGGDRARAAAGSASRDEGASSSGGDRGSGGGGRGRPRREDREPMPEDEQRSAGEEFLNGQLEAFGYEASVLSSLDDDGVLLFEVRGDGLGLLIGPGLNTLDALQEVCRNAIQRQADGREYGKVVLDVAGVRAERAAALEEFVRNEAENVLDSGDEVVFEVMSRSDRKIVHDVVGEIDGLGTESVGEDPRRRVVLKRR